MNAKDPIIVPVLVIGFNRPEIILQSIAKLRESKPQNVYLACDGAREYKDGEQELVQQVRNIMENEIDWKCEKHYRYNSENKGCEVTESEAITWVLGENEYVIVVEDDIIAPYSFLKFAQEMLYRYKDDERVYMVSSDNTTPIEMPNNEDYLFSMYGHIWGWATWRRAWEHFDLYVDDFDTTLTKIPDRTDLSDFDKKKFAKTCMGLRKKGAGKSTWDVVWSYVKWRDGGLSIVPREHLSSNVGVVGLHTKERSSCHYRNYDEEFVVRTHPLNVVRNKDYDAYHYKHHIKKPSYFVRQYRRAIRLMKRIIKL